MEYAAYKFNFRGAVHFGQRILESCDITFSADRLFSALAFAALDDGENLNRLVNLAAKGELLFSDAFPFAGDEYFCPKPMIRHAGIETEENIAKRKTFKKLQYLPCKSLTAYLSGKATAEDLLPPAYDDFDKCMAESARPSKKRDFGKFAVKTSVNLTDYDDPRPYRVGTFSFRPDGGLYVIVGYEDEEDLFFVEELLESVSFSGIGGKRSAGLGRFDLGRGKISAETEQRLKGEYKTYMTLAAALPVAEDMVAALSGASCLLEKKSGFVASPDYAPEWRRKRDSFAFRCGSCFGAKFAGQLQNVAGAGGKHPVYRYLQPLFMGVM